MKRILTTVSAMFALPLVAAFPIAQAQTDVITKVNPGPDPNKGHASSYWTPERFKSAKPLPMPTVKPDADMKSKEAAAPKLADPRAGSNAYAPPEEPAPAVEHLYDSAPAAEKAPRDEILQPRDK